MVRVRLREIRRFDEASPRAIPTFALCNTLDIHSCPASLVARRYPVITADRPSAVLRVQNLSKAYTPGQYAIRDVTLSFGRDEIVAIIGRSGAGKSTLLRCLNLLVHPTQGMVELAGREVTHAYGRSLRELRGRVGMIFQGFNLVRRVSVLQNVLAGRTRFCTGPLGMVSTICHRFPMRDQEIAMECLHKVGIADLAHRRSDSLSGGQQQRVAIARVLAQEPDVILADEPIASLDPRSARAVMETLRDIHASRHVPVIVNLHQVDVAREFATRIVGMASGRVLLDTTPKALDAADVHTIYHQTADAPIASSPDARADTREELNPLASAC
jgi:phosphonate transport system ATP-binding protein